MSHDANGSNEHHASGPPVLPQVPEKVASFADARLKPEDVARLWMSENSIVNAKVAYFTAVNGALAVSLMQSAKWHIAFLISIAGLASASIALLSIARTCAYRRRFRDSLEDNEDYKMLFTVKLQFLETLKSNTILKVVPGLTVLAWAAILITTGVLGRSPQEWQGIVDGARPTAGSASSAKQ